VEGRAPGAEGAVGDQLHRADDESPVADGLRPALETVTPRGFDGRVPHDPPADRIGCPAVDTPEPERAGARPRRVTIDPGERDRVPRRRPVEGHPGREPAPGPPRLVPAAAGDPLVGQSAPGRLRHRTGDLRLGTRAARVEGQARSREPGQMRVRVDEPGQHGAPAEVQDRLGPGHVRVAAPPREDDPAVADDQGVDHRTRRVHRVDPAVRQEHGRDCRLARPGVSRRPPRESPGSPESVTRAPKPSPCGRGGSVSPGALARPPPLSPTTCVVSDVGTTAGAPWHAPRSCQV
jgi:hypothetical protein